MRIVMLAALLSLSGACAVQPQPDPIDATIAEINSGRMIAENKCAACHAVGVTGNSPFREAPPFRFLSERYPISGLEEALGEGIATGHPSMPEWIFKPSEINELLGYIQSVQINSTDKHSR